jgi:hypothetical protein
MALPTSNGTEIFVVESGAAGIELFNHANVNEGKVWNVARFNNRLAWIDSAYLVPESTGSARATEIAPNAPLSTNHAERSSATASPTPLYDLLTKVVIALAAFVTAGFLANSRYNKWQQARWSRKVDQELRETTFSHEELQEKRQCYVPTRIQPHYPSDSPEPDQEDAEDFGTDGITFYLKRFLKSPDPTCYVLLGDSGMGKTTFLIHLHTRYMQHRKPFHPKTQLMLLSDPGCEENIANVSTAERRKTILLLDAFDEVPAPASYKVRLDTLIRSTSNFYRVLVTCRTQFFPTVGSEADIIPKATRADGPVRFEKRYISVFRERDITNYLRQRFPPWHIRTRDKRQRAYRIVANAKHLMMRPMLLANVDQLTQEGPDKYQKSIQIYEAMIDHWLEREREKVRQDTYKERLLKFSKDLAVKLWERSRVGMGLTISEEEIDDMANANQIDLQKLTKEHISSRSLLNRTFDNDFKFAHKSFVEYLIARRAIEDLKFAIFLFTTGFEHVGGAKRFLTEYLQVSRPDGLAYPGDREVLKQDLIGKRRTLDPPGMVVINESDSVHAFCDSSCLPGHIRFLPLLSKPVYMYLFYRSGSELSAEQAREWAATIADCSQFIEAVDLRSDSPGATNIYDMLRPAFAEQHIGSKLQLIT